MQKCYLTFIDLIRFLLKLSNNFDPSRAAELRFDKLLELLARSLWRCDRFVSFVRANSSLVTVVVCGFGWLFSCELQLLVAYGFVHDCDDNGDRFSCIDWFDVVCFLTVRSLIGVWPKIGFTIKSSFFPNNFSLEPVHDMLLFASDIIESQDFTSFKINGLFVLDGEFKLLLHRKHNAKFTSPCNIVCVPTLYVWSISASTRKSRFAHRHVSQCFTLAAFNLSSKYLAMPSGGTNWSSALFAAFKFFDDDIPIRLEIEEKYNVNICN